MDLDARVANESRLGPVPDAAHERAWWRLSVPDGIHPRSYFACLTASALLMVFLGIQIILTLLMWVKLPTARTSDLTGVGIFNFRPEYDAFIYVLGLPITLVLVLANTWWWNRRLRHPAPSDARRAVILNALQLGAGLAATGIFLYQFTGAQQYALRGEPIPNVYYVLFALLGLMLAQAALAWPGRFASFALPREAEQPAAARRFSLVWDVLFALVIVVIVYVPSWDQLSGHIFQAERYFHWDFFAMGPALAFKYGAALGTDVFSFYGLGWPVLFALASPLAKLSYGSMINLSTIYGSIYFIGIYLLLKLVTGRRLWAAAGTLLALRIHLFSGLAFLSPLWRFPSVTVMRRPFDVWFFIALVMYIKSRRPGWLLGAGALTGVALFFETDTGLYLAAALGLFLLGKLVQGGFRRRDLALAGGSVALGVSVLGAGLAIASRGEVFSGVFWQGWLDNLKLTSGGYTLMPLIGRLALYEGGGPVHGRHLALLFLVVAVSLGFVAHLVIKLAHRQATPMELVLGSLAIYSFLGMIQFMGRSDPLNLYPLMIPFAVLVAIMACRLDGILLAALRRPGLRRSGLKAAAGGAALGTLAIAAVSLSLVVNKPFQNYPNLIRALGNGVLANENCLTDVPVDGRFLSARGPACGATTANEHEKFKAEFPEVVRQIKSRGQAGERVAVLDQDGPIFYQAAGVAPWGRYQPVFPNLITKQRLDNFARQLGTERPENVLIRSRLGNGPFYNIYSDIQDRLFPVINANYYLQERIGTFELWRRRGLPPPATPAGV